MTSSPVLLLHWLSEGDEREAAAVMKDAAAKNIDITFDDVSTAAEAKAAIQRWLQDNSNAQYQQLVGVSFSQHLRNQQLRGSRFYR